MLASIVLAHGGIGESFGALPFVPASAKRDYNGNTLTKVVGSNTTSYTWDFENRLSSVTLPNGGGTVSFKYDPFGRRIYKSSSAATSVYAYDGDNLMEETNSSGTVVARYSDGLNIDEPLAMLRSSATSFYHADGLGSITSLTNSAGSVAQTYSFDSFGNQTGSSGSLTNSFRYTAREFDTETSLYYYRARYYDPITSGFASDDPVRFKAGVNFYSYVKNSATNLTDPHGLTCAQMPMTPCVDALNKCLADNQKHYDDLVAQQRAKFLACLADCGESHPPISWLSIQSLAKCLMKCDLEFLGQLLGDNIAKSGADLDCMLRVGALCSQRASR